MDCILVPEKLSLNELPTNGNILRAYVYEREKWLLDNDTEKEPDTSLISTLIGKQVRRIYKKAKIKTMKKCKIRQEVAKIYKSRLNLLKVALSKRSSKPFLKKVEVYKSFLSNKFEITQRKSKPPSKKNSNDRKKIEKTNTELIPSSGKRAAAIISRQKTFALVTNEMQNDTDFKSPQSDPANFRTLDLSEVVEIKSRFAGSDRYTAAIVNATLRMVGIPPSVDKSKLRRAQHKNFARLNKEEIHAEFGGGLYYDSRKDLTLTIRKRTIDGKFKFYKKLDRIEHFSLVSQPEGAFLGFVETEEGSAVCVSKTIISFSKEKKIFPLLQVLGSDGTNLNVGADGGINQYIEAELERPLHWFICLLHANELPLKALIIKLDGKTSGASNFSGPIGKSLNGVCDLPIVAFKRFRHVKELEEIPDFVLKKMSNDQKYLYNIVNALISGVFPESLSQMKIGNLNHSRWVTTASRICRLYASTLAPSNTLKILTSYIVEIYAPTWFQIKSNELAVNGPENLFFLIKKSKLIKDQVAKKIVQDRIRRNAFFAHSENVLLAQLASDKKRIRTDAVKKILHIRQGFHDGKVRTFKVPDINFDAKSYTDIGILAENNMFEPPLTMNMTENELLALKEKPLIVPKFKCHTQMVERAVKEVTRVSEKIIDNDKRNSMVKATLISRSKFPKFDSLKDHSVENKKDCVCILPKT